MKKIISVLLIILGVLFTGCTRKENTGAEPVKNETVKSGSNNTNAPKGIAYNKIAFEAVDEAAAPKELGDKIESLRKNRGFAFYEDKSSGYIYIAVFAGEKNTGGHSIKVINIGDSEGRTEVTVQEKAPGKGDIVTQVITYPYTLVKAKGITPNISVQDEKGNKFVELK